MYVYVFLYVLFKSKNAKRRVYCAVFDRLVYGNDYIIVMFPQKGSFVCAMFSFFLGQKIKIIILLNRYRFGAELHGELRV